MSHQLRPANDLRRDVLEAMAKKSISARQIMRETGISHITVNRFLRGIGETRPATIVKLCQHLGLDWYSPDEQGVRA